MRINHIALVCSSEEKANTFYKDLLGLEKIRTFNVPSNISHKVFNSEKQYKVIVYSNNEVKIEVFIDEKSIIGQTSIPHLCIEVRDRERLISKCKKLGIYFQKIPKEDSFYLFIRDSDGNLFEIKEEMKGMVE